MVTVEELPEAPEDESEQNDELDAEANEAKEQADADLLKRMDDLINAVKDNTATLEKITEQLPAVESFKSAPVRDQKELGLDDDDLDPNDKDDAAALKTKKKATAKTQKVLDDNADTTDPETGEKKSNSEWAAGKWIAGLTAVTAALPILMKCFEGIARIVSGRGTSDILDAETEAKLRAFVAQHQAQPDATFWPDLAANMKSKQPPPNAAELIYVFQFIVIANPIATEYTWDSSDYNTLIAQVEQSYKSDPVGFVGTLGTLKGTANPKLLPRATAAGLAQSAVALSMP